MNLSGVLIGSEDPKPLADYYTKLFGTPGFEQDGFTGWQIGPGWVVVGTHDRRGVRTDDPDGLSELRGLLGTDRCWRGASGQICGSACRS